MHPTQKITMLTDPGHGCLAILPLRSISIPVRNLGIILGSSFSFSDPIQSITSSSYRALDSVPLSSFLWQCHSSGLCQSLPGQPQFPPDLSLQSVLHTTTNRIFLRCKSDSDNPQLKIISWFLWMKSTVFSKPSWSGYCWLLSPVSRHCLSSPHSPLLGPSVLLPELEHIIPFV